ncbi:hypothetical protein EC957_006913 [Mortierella hygrophila]|uniref:Uncharacterized protein n=1 Tax=Mortierella hygrophila TaxID=979708 RepID=A0A9P6EYQ8_9FUNG|nr:hypothetical protein EC957_006913 [Mortierella hygrophila]
MGRRRINTQPDSTCGALTFVEICDAAVSSLQKPVMGVVDQAKCIVESLLTLIEEVAKYTVVLTSALATLSSIIKKHADALATMAGLPALLLTLGSSTLYPAVEPAQQVARRRGVPKNCLGIKV